MAWLWVGRFTNETEGVSVKVRDSGMPDEEMWAGFFDPDKILRTFGLDHETGDIVEFGCGYGTFTLTAAKIIRGIVNAYDIEPAMVAAISDRSCQAGIKNIRAVIRDLVAQGTGLPQDSMDAALLFNILHHDQPVALMKEAFRVLQVEGYLAIIHWNYDPATPRGPAMEIRPRPEQCIEWGREAGFRYNEREQFDFPPYHYGLLLRK
jgi:SAM-dependent methyltransferase